MASSAGGSFAQFGAGTTILSGANTYGGGTTVHTGTLIAAHHQAVGTGTVTVEGGVFLLETGVSLANVVHLSGGAYHREMAGGSNLADAINASSTFAGDRPDTAAEILQGTLTTNALLETHFSETSGALNDGTRQSDVYSLHGTGSDIFVLQLSISGLDSGSSLGWLDTDIGSATYNQWVNAVEGNDGGMPVFFARGYNAATDFHLGYYGVDLNTGSVWAVLNHNSDFAIIPEPSTGALLALALGGILFHRRWQRS